MPWLYGITTNVISLHRRAEVRGYRALTRTGEDPVVAAFDDRVAAQVSASATRQRLAAALVKLGRGERDVLLLQPGAQGPPVCDPAGCRPRPWKKKRLSEEQGRKATEFSSCEGQ
ncbi:hypothetical protein [Nonomuraea sp. WAC 01424]|uniref:hypothetical protein n=1 Tax=Nonomuraea sp. WAC 01424 TaxID=2203200 RepID=UPI00163C3438|nr:hypothetical protein [Nonomuraea sp. WAC 01424]